MVALVTGADGFLGGYITSRLGEAGWEVVAAGRPQMDIPSDQFTAIVNRSAPELVVHCAGPASVAGSLADPHTDFEGSVGVLAAVLDLLRSLQTPPRIVLLSSAAVYGQPTTLPVDEDAPLNPVSPYGFHRLSCELLLREYSQIYALPGTSLRIFSAYGEGLRRQLLWDVCARAVQSGRIELSGTGSETRDFVHANDVANAVLTILGHAPFEGESYNVASGRETSVTEVARLLGEELGLTSCDISFSGEARPGDPTNWRADISRLQAMGFTPRVPIDSGAAAFARWVRDQERVTSTAGPTLVT